LVDIATQTSQYQSPFLVIMAMAKATTKPQARTIVNKTKASQKPHVQKTKGPTQRVPTTKNIQHLMEAMTRNIQRKNPRNTVPGQGKMQGMWLKQRLVME